MEPGPHLILFYDYVEDIAERRAPHRAAHLDHIERHRAEGSLVAAGATGDPVAGGLLVFRDVDADAVAAFVRDDPYQHAGLITAWRTEPWNVV